jgi:anion-transporting  ArsA/GET3 family ATPase
MASRPFYQAADRILGSQFLEDIAEFFLLFQSMYPGFVQRAGAVKRLLHDRRTTFVVVTTLEAAPVREAEFFLDALAQQGFHAGALVLNKVLPAYLLEPEAARVAEHLVSSAADVAGALTGSGLRDPNAMTGLRDPSSREAVSRVLREVGESFLNFEVVAKREAELRAELSAAADMVVTVPSFETDIFDVAGLVRLGRAIWV